MKTFRNEDAVSYIESNVHLFPTVAHISDFDTKCNAVRGIIATSNPNNCVLYDNGHGLLKAVELPDSVCEKFLPDLQNFQNLQSLSIGSYCQTRLFIRNWPLTLEAVEIGKRGISDSAPDLNALGSLPRLRSLMLNMHSVRLEDLYGLADNLEILSFGSAKDMQKIERFQKLEMLDYGVQDEPLTAVGQLPNLKTLCIERLNHHNLDGLENCKALEGIRIQSKELSDIQALAPLNNLKVISVHCPALEDISFLAGKPLECLDIIGASVLDFSPLTEMTELQSLFLNNTYFEDSSALVGMKNLKELYLRNTLTADLSPLAKLENLETLDLRMCQKINDLSPLYGLKKLKSVWLDNGIRDATLKDAKLTQSFRRLLDNGIFSGF